MSTDTEHTALALLLHELGVGCDYEYNDPYDIGMGRHHTGDHESDAARLVAAIDEMTDHPSPLADASQSEALPPCACGHEHREHYFGDRVMTTPCQRCACKRYAALAARSSEPPASPAPTHPFIKSPYGPNRCRDCDHPREWHASPAPASPDEPTITRQQCAKEGVSRASDWRITVMGAIPRTSGSLFVCEDHATFYLRQGQAIYPAERVWPSAGRMQP